MLLALLILAIIVLAIGIKTKWTFRLTRRSTYEEVSEEELAQIEAEVAKGENYEMYESDEEEYEMYEPDDDE